MQEDRLAVKGRDDMGPS